MYIINLGAEANFIVASVPHITIKGTDGLPVSSKRSASRPGRTTMPTTEKGTNPARPTPFASRRAREYLTAREIDALMGTVRRSNRHGHRDATMILIAYRHGLRPSEVCALRRDQIGIATVGGVIVGAFLMAKARGAFRIESFTDSGDMIRHMIGGAIMGMGGILAMGCTIGQGLTGMSTLALASVLAFASIVAGGVFGIRYLEQGSLAAAAKALMARQ